jgi:hypothetical protein
MSEGHGITLWAAHRGFFLLLLYVALLQGLLFAYDLNHPDVFLHADRALDRMHAINELQALLDGQSTFATFLSRQGTAMGVPGDYIVQGVLFHFGGQYSVILFQIALFLVSLVALYHLTFLLTNSVKIGFWVTLIFAHLPYGAMFPHMLWSEALFNPLILLSFCFVGRATLRPNGILNVVLAATFLALAALVRVVAIPWLVIVLVGFHLCRLPIRKLAIYVVVFAAIFSAWPLIAALSTGRAVMGGGDHSAINHLAYSMRVRIDTMIESLPAAEREEAHRRYADPGEFDRISGGLKMYADFAIRYPLIVTKAFFQDVAIFVAQSGIERFTIDFLELAGNRESMQEDRHGWREQLMLNGPSAALLIFFQKDQFVIIISLLTALAMLPLWALAAVGIWHISSSASTRWLTFKARVNLLSMPFFIAYAFAPNTLVYYPQARYRSPAEFCLCILAVIGWYAIRSRYSSASGSQQELPAGAQS